MNRVTIKLFGTFREFAANDQLVLEAPEAITIQELRQRLAQKIQQDYPNFPHVELLACSALATSESILHNSDILGANTELNIIPPVSGG